MNFTNSVDEVDYGNDSIHLLTKSSDSKNVKGENVESEKVEILQDGSFEEGEVVKSPEKDKNETEFDNEQTECVTVIKNENSDMEDGEISDSGDDVPEILSCTNVFMDETVKKRLERFKTISNTFSTPLVSENFGIYKASSKNKIEKDEWTARMVTEVKKPTWVREEGRDNRYKPQYFKSDNNDYKTTNRNRYELRPNRHYLDRYDDKYDSNRASQEKWSTRKSNSDRFDRTSPRNDKRNSYRGGHRHSSSEDDRGRYSKKTSNNRRYSKDRSYRRDKSSEESVDPRYKRDRSEQWRDPYIRQKREKHEKETIKRSLPSIKRSVSREIKRVSTSQEQSRGSHSPQIKNRFSSDFKRDKSSSRSKSKSKRTNKSSSRSLSKNLKSKVVSVKKTPTKKQHTKKTKVSVSDSESNSSSSSGSCCTKSDSNSSDDSKIVEKNESQKSKSLIKPTEKSRRVEKSISSNDSCDSDSTTITSLSLSLRESDVSDQDCKTSKHKSKKPKPLDSSESVDEKSKRKSDLLLQLDLIDRAILRKRSKKN